MSAPSPDFLKSLARHFRDERKRFPSLHHTLAFSANKQFAREITEGTQANVDDPSRPVVFASAPLTGLDLAPKLVLPASLDLIYLHIFCGHGLSVYQSLSRLTFGFFGDGGDVEWAPLAWSEALHGLLGPEFEPDSVDPLDYDLFYISRLDYDVFKESARAMSRLAEITRPSKLGTVEQAILEALRDGPATVGAIERKTGMDESNLRKARKRLKTRGLIDHADGIGFYLTEAGLDVLSQL